MRCRSARPLRLLPDRPAGALSTAKQTSEEKWFPSIDATQPQTQAIELRDTLVQGFLCKITPTGRKVFMF